MNGVRHPSLCAAWPVIMVDMDSASWTSSLRRAVGTWHPGEVGAAVAGLVAGAVMSYLLYRFARRVARQRPFRLRIVLVHALAAPVFGLLFVLLSIGIESLFTGSLTNTRTAWRVVELPSELPAISLLLYVVVVGVAYSVERREQAAYAAAEAARARLAALRTQLHPHFLFNSMHTVVQLIHVNPERAVQAAELIASLLRRTLEDERDVVTLEEEWAFVSRYLEVERMRFGDRLRVRSDIDSGLFSERVPSFALQTLVENAVRHGAANRVEPTDIIVSASLTQSMLRLAVSNDGAAVPTRNGESGVGTGLSRLRQRVAFLYGDNARLTSGARVDGSFEAVLEVPRRSVE
jgi:two-component system, LytTR family, sensor kinase